MQGDRPRRGYAARLPVDELPPGPFGAEVRRGDVPASVDAPILRTPTLLASAAEAVLTVPGVARFHVRGGREVVVAAEPGATAADVATYVEGRVASILLQQQGRFALHGTAVRVGRAAVVVTGRSGAGKSSTAAVLLRWGHQLVADDVTGVDVAGPHGWARPLARDLRLVAGTAHRLGLDPTGFVAGPPGKVRVPVPPPPPSPVPVVVVVALRGAAGVPAPDLVPCAATEAVVALADDTYGRNLARVRPGAHFRWLSALAARVPVYRLVRPVGTWTVDAVAAAVLRAAATGPNA